MSDKCDSKGEYDRRLLEALLERIFPDPVDRFEDDLAKWNGLLRFPGLSTTSWRQARVEFLSALGHCDGGDGLPDAEKEDSDCG